MGLLTDKFQKFLNKKINDPINSNRIKSPNDVTKDLQKEAADNNLTLIFNIEGTLYPDPSTLPSGDILVANVMESNLTGHLVIVDFDLDVIS